MANTETLERPANLLAWARLEAGTVAATGPRTIPFHTDWIEPAPLVLAPQLQPFTVNIGRRGEPRLSFGAMAVSSMVAVDQHLCLAEVGERVEAVPLRAEPATVNAARHQLEEAQLRELPDTVRAYAVEELRGNGEPSGWYDVTEDSRIGGAWRTRAVPGTRARSAGAAMALYRSQVKS